MFIKVNMHVDVCRKLGLHGNCLYATYIKVVTNKVLTMNMPQKVKGSVGHIKLEVFGDSFLQKE
jgi:hypothetical protein